MTIKQQMRIGRRKAIACLKQLGIFADSLSYQELLRLLFDNKLCGVRKKRNISQKMLEKEFIRIANEVDVVVEVAKTLTQPKKLVMQSRKIESTLPCPTKKADDIPKEKKSDIVPNPIGYKSRCREDEPFNLIPKVFYKSWRWKELRLIALDTYGRRCVSCGASPSADNYVVLNVDHIKPLRLNPELALDLSNLQVLCQDCNQGKSWFNEKDYRSDDQKILSKKEFSFEVTEELLAKLHDNFKDYF